MRRKKEIWSIAKIFIRIVTYPFCLLFIFMAIFTFYTTLKEGAGIEQVGFGLGFPMIILSLVGTYLYYDLREILGYSTETLIELEDVLDDEL